MNECEPNGFKVQNGWVFLESDNPLRGSHWQEFRRELGNVGVHDLSKVLINSGGTWKRLVFLPPLSAHDVERLIKDREFATESRNLNNLRGLL